METSNTRSKATFTHLSTLAQYFIPFGNFIFPLVIWSSTKKDSEFIDNHGKQAVNFQLSIFLYTLTLCFIAIPTLLYSIFKSIPLSAVINDDDFILQNLTTNNFTGVVIIALTALLLLVMMKVGEFFLVIFASVKAANGEEYQYPMSIKFIK